MWVVMYTLTVIFVSTSTSMHMSYGAATSYQLHYRTLEECQKQKKYHTGGNYHARCDWQMQPVGPKPLTKP